MPQYDKELAQKMPALVGTWKLILKDIREGKLSVEAVLAGLHQISLGKFGPKPPKENIVKIITPDGFMVPALNGKRMIVTSKAFARIGSHLDHFGLRRPGVATPRAKVKIAQMTEDGNFADMFASLKFPLEEMWLTQDQYLEFRASHRDELHPELCNFVLFKVDDNKPATPDNLIVFYERKNKQRNCEVDARDFQLKRDWHKPHYIIFRQPAGE